MNRYKLRTAPLAVALLVSLTAGTAWSHGSSTTSIHIGQAAGQLTVGNGVDFGGTQLFADNSETFDGFGQSIVPGISVDASLNSALLQFRIIDNLFYWTPAEGLGATTSNTLTINRTIFPTGEPDSAVASQAGIPDALIHFWDSATVGQSHHILRYDVPAAAESAAYGLLMQVEDVSSVLDPSQPFLLILNNGLTNTPGPVAGQPLDASQFGQAVSAISVEAVPEPSSCALLLLGAIGCAVWRRRS